MKRTSRKKKLTTSESKANTKMNVKRERPDDYHCNCEYCSKLFCGELIQKDGTYYSARKREGYSLDEGKHKHLDKGHWQGYAFIIERYTLPAYTVFDPMAGSGTAMVEALKIGRKAVGIELEYPELTRINCSLYPVSQWKVYEGDAREQIDKVQERADLIVTGPVYNNNSDRPERKKIGGKDQTYNYRKDLPNLAWLKDDEYFKEITKLYKDCCSRLKTGGYFVIIIKDPIRKKEPYLLHYEIGKRLEEIGLVPKHVWIHKHYPPTLFINTYGKKFSKVLVPKYQTMLVFQKQ